MSFFYFLQHQLNAFASPPAIYYFSQAIQQPTANVILIDQTSPSQVEEKQTFIIQSSVITRDSLPSQSEERPKNLKKKRAPKKEKDESFGWRNQNKDRNMFSNILKAFVSYVLEHGGMHAYLNHLYQSLRLQNGVSGFCEHLSRQFPPNKSYISPKMIAQMLKDPAQPQGFTTGLKLALARFLRMDYALVLLKSSKIKRRSKIEQMKRSRELREVIFSR